MDQPDPQYADIYIKLIFFSRTILCIIVKWFDLFYAVY
jgi:hypothetical protein